MYIASVQNVKRVILRLIEIPVRSLGMQSPALLRLIQTCNTGAETLITRILHILTESTPPTPSLVDSIRELYASGKVTDVR